MPLEIRLLGPLEVNVDGRPIRITGRLRALLLVLAMSAGRSVSLDRLVVAMWGEELPTHPRASLQNYVMRLRTLLGAAQIGTNPIGYVLHAGADEVDALRFLNLLDASAAASDSLAERQSLTAALALWRGTPFEGVRSKWLEESEAPRLVERYLTGVERRIDLDVADGRHADLVAELRQLTSRFPLREPMWVRLLQVLDRCGRPAEALEAYEGLRRRIADELGADPGPELRAIHAQLLSGRVPAPRPAIVPAEAQRIVPRQLPADTPGFAGREAILATMDSLVGPAMAPVVITAIGGVAGIGKTTLAVHWAHRVADRFPDGQLYVNLRGFDPSESPRAPGEVVRGFLDALQVPQHQIPSNLDGQVGLYRSLLAGKRMLIVLDNARNADQVRPMLPGSPGCLVIVTSRDQLLSLVAAEGARPLALAVLSTDEARQLLVHRLGRQRVTADPTAIEEIIRRCGWLPLALAVVAARAALRPDVPLGSVAEELRGLDAFGDAEPVTDLRTVFSWSYNILSPAAARLFRLLGRHPGPDVSIAAAASIAGVPMPEARTLIAELAGAHLVTEHAYGRFVFHDLLRAYAVEEAAAQESEPDRRAAAHRMLDFYLHHARTATGLLDPNRELLDIAAAQPGVIIDGPADHDQALAWLQAEDRVLQKAIEWSAEHDFDIYAFQLAWSLAGFFDLRGQWHDLLTTQHVAMDAARRIGDLRLQARSHRHFARAYTRLLRFNDAEDHLRQAIELARELGDRVAEARARTHLAFNFERQGDYNHALDQVGHALTLYRAGGLRRGEAMALNGIGWFHAKVGDYEMALKFCEQALVIHQELSNSYGEASTWDSLGYAHQHLGDHARALSCYQHSLDLYEGLGDLYGTADTLVRLGDTHVAMADPGTARAVWQQALDIFLELGHPDADLARAKLYP